MSLGLHRPKSLREVAAESASYSDFGHNLKDFLHEFAEAHKKNLPLEPMLIDQPRWLSSTFAEGNVCDAFLAAIADYLARVNGIPTPIWALDSKRVLDRPWFSLEYPQIRLRLLRDTPSAFKDKNIFIFENALNVA